MPSQMEILEHLNKMREATSGDLARKLNCNPITIRVHLLRLLVYGRVSRYQRNLLPPQRGAEFVYMINAAGRTRLKSLKQERQE